MSVGGNICKYRIINNLTQEEFAYRVNVSRQTVYKWEHDISIPRCDKVMIICEVLNINYDKLFEEIGT